MSIVEIAAFVLSILLFVFLFWAVLYPEKL
ncbi:MAG: potassium-transporting ATPase subunit F [Actinomycetota bacterium]|nr:potassium-transporting ATPase subunit F [Actinomycetota bacterium]